MGEGRYVRIFKDWHVSYSSSSQYQDALYVCNNVNSLNTFFNNREHYKRNKINVSREAGM